MRIFINALSARLGGGQTYLLNLLKHVPQDIDLKVYVLVQPSFNLGDLPSNVTILNEEKLENPWKRVIWEETRLIECLKELKIQLFFSPGGLLPKRLPGNILTVVTFQNMLPFDRLQRSKYPYGYRALRDWLLERGLSSAMRSADFVIFISQFAKRFVHEKLRDMHGENAVVPHGIHPCFRVDKSAPLARPSWAPIGNYFLYVSWIDHYKAQLEIVDGFRLYREQGGQGQLLLVGAEYKPYGDRVRQKIKTFGLEAFVKLIGNVAHEELPAAYQNAQINIFASFTENCPNILLEMMASGRPALVSNWGPMTEFGGEAVEYFDPSRPEDFAKNLRSLVDNSERQCNLGDAGIKQVSNYTWEQASFMTWSVIANVGQSQYRE